MYRTSELRSTETAGNVPELSSGKLNQLTKERRVDISDRIEILQMLAGYKWVGEVAHEVNATRSPGPTERQGVAISLLNHMGLASSFDWIERGGKYYSWVQFAVNQPMLDIFMDKEHPFNVIEQGAVYGFPMSATLAFAGVIPKKLVRQKNVAEYHIFGVNSEKYYEREVEYAERMWAHLCDIAPGLTAEAFEDYERIAKKIATSL